MINTQLNLYERHNKINILVKRKCAFGWNTEGVFDAQESTEFKTLKLKQRSLLLWRNISSRKDAAINKTIEAMN
jgi:hypothetical protein